MVDSDCSYSVHLEKFGSFDSFLIDMAAHCLLRSVICVLGQRSYKGSEWVRRWFLTSSYPEIL